MPRSKSLILMVLAGILVSAGSGQSTPSLPEPFQVIYSNSVRKVSTGKVIDSGEKIGTNERLEIMDGHLILAYHSGRFLEFEGDTILNIASIIEPLKNRSSTPKTKLVDVEMLYDREYDGGVFHGGGMKNLEMVILCHQQLYVNLNDVFCLKWKSRSKRSSTPNSYVVILKNIHDDILDEIETSQQSIELDLSVYGDQAGGYFNVMVMDRDNFNYRTQSVGIEYGDVQSNIIALCNISTAIQALEAAYALETTPYLTHEAYFYYQLANQIAQKPIYYDFLKNYEDRRGL